LQSAGVLTVVTIAPEIGCSLELESIPNSSSPGCPKMTHVEDKEAEDEEGCVLIVEDVLGAEVTVVKTLPKDVVPALTLGITTEDVDEEARWPE